MIKKIRSEEEFEKEIKEGNLIVDFSATWCGPCRMMEPVLEELSSKIKIFKVDIDELEVLTRKLGIMSVPTMIIYKDGKEVKKVVGYHSLEEMESMIA